MSDSPGPIDPLDPFTQLRMVNDAETAVQAQQAWQISRERPAVAVRLVMALLALPVTPQGVVDQLSAIPRKQVEAMSSRVFQGPDKEQAEHVATAAVSALIAFHNQLTRLAHEEPEMPISVAVHNHAKPAYLDTLERYGVRPDQVEWLRSLGADI